LGSGAKPRRKNFLKPLPRGELPAVVGKAYDFSLWLIQKVEHFPRSYRFSVGDKLVSGVLDLLLRLVDAAYARDKVSILTDVNGHLNRLRFLLRLAKDLKLLSVESYGFVAQQAEEIGRMAGGWRKASVPAGTLPRRDQEGTADFPAAPERPAILRAPPRKSEGGR
jgi:hypothetical protein